jgi:ABC-2 type transport system ATP-binding protein
MHDPQLLFLEEPTTGLDPQSRLAIWDHLRELNSRGLTVFMTTQMMEEADRLCERIAIVDKGTIVVEGSPMSLKTEIGGMSYRSASLHRKTNSKMGLHRKPSTC